jgi:hypothetical protein
MSLKKSDDYALVEMRNHFKKKQHATRRFRGHRGKEETISLDDSALRLAEVMGLSKGDPV